ncbi:hypothetical protein E4U21_007067 [Claviceps maximensis]|nr:hypothetical protein E4U21_007067 [Claviceps maximensis]
MEDPAYAWPAWKFGMKRDDLFTTLHNQYNTFSHTLQDPEAFHHDVYEISQDADTVVEFHRLMADRREMRLRELHESLKTLAVEIIANPKLMATEQWDAAVQLFRTKSYDSIVRYFASYIPQNYIDRHGTRDVHSVTTSTFSCASSSSSSSSSFCENDTFSTTASYADQGPFLFTDDDYFPHGPVMTCEPDIIKDEGGRKRDHRSCEPLSPPFSEAAHSHSSASTPPSDADHNDFSTNSISRSMSLCGCSEGELIESDLHQTYVKTSFETSDFVDYDVVNSDDVPSYAVVEASNKHELHQHDVRDTAGLAVDEDEDFPTTQYPDDELVSDDFFHFSCLQDTLNSDTPTSRPEALSASHVEFVLLKPLNASLSVCRSLSPKSPLGRRGAGTSGTSSRQVRRSPDEASCKIQKSVQVSTTRTRKRRTPPKMD